MAGKKALIEAIMAFSKKPSGKTKSIAKPKTKSIAKPKTKVVAKPKTKVVAKPKTKKVGQPAKYKTMEEAKSAAKKAGKKTFYFKRKKYEVAKKKESKIASVRKLTEGMSKEEAKAFRYKRQKEIQGLKDAQKRDMASDLYNQDKKIAARYAKKLTPAGEKLLSQGTKGVDKILRATKFMKVKKYTKDGKSIGKTTTQPVNKYMSYGIDTRGAPLLAKGAKPVTTAEKKAWREKWEGSDLSSEERLANLLDREPPLLTSSQVADKLGMDRVLMTKTTAGKSYAVPVREAPKMVKFPKRKSVTPAMKLAGTLTTQKKLRKDITKIIRGDLGGEKKSFASNIPNKALSKKLKDKRVSYSIDRDAPYTSKTKKPKTASIHPYRPEEVKEYNEALNKAKNKLVSNPASATFKDLKNRSIIKNAKPGSPYDDIKKRIFKLEKEQKQDSIKLVKSLKMKMDNLQAGKPAATGVKQKFGTIKRKQGGVLKYKSGTGKKTVGRKSKSKLGKFKGAMYSLMPLGAYDTLDMIDTAIRTGLPFKQGTSNKTIRGVGRALRGYGKVTKRRTK